MNIRNKKILITGATGFLGKRCVEIFSKHNNIIATGRNIEKAIKGSNIIFIQADLTNILDNKLFEGVDYVIHCAALSSPWGKYEDFYRSNVIATKQICEKCIEHNIKKLIHISSPSIYFNGKDQLNIKENELSDAKKINSYAQTKYLAEQEIHKYKEKGLNYIILRPRAIFGPEDYTLLPRIIKINSEKFIPKMLNNNGPLCDLTYVDNLVEAIALAIEADPKYNTEAYNITNDEPIMLLDTIKKLIEECNLQFNSKKVPYILAIFFAILLEVIHKYLLNNKEPRFTKYTVLLLKRNQTLDISKAKQDLKYSPIVNMEEGIRRTINWYKNERN